MRLMARFFMATQRRSGRVGALVGLALGAATGCGSFEHAAGPAATPPPVPAPAHAQPRAVSGGTLLVLADGRTAVAADPDRDVIWLADVSQLVPTGRIDLPSGDEPGRLVQDRAGKVHVALRRGGALLTIDPQAARILDRRPACAAPRGLAYDPVTDRLHLACAGGELVTFAASGGAALRTVQLDGDLRDVVVSGTNLLVSRFRSAELLTVDADGAVTSRVKPQAVRRVQSPSGNDPMPMSMALAEPAVAWQLHALPDGQVAMLFERATTSDAIDTSRPGGYGNGQCPGGGIVSSAITILSPSGAEQPGPSLPAVAYSVDFAVSPDGSELSLVTPAQPPSMPSGVFTLLRANLATSDPCNVVVSPRFLTHSLDVSTEVVAVAYDGRKRLVMLTRDPVTLAVGDSLIRFKDAAVASDAGHQLFHTPTAAAMACVSCHPEGGDDGRVWNFTPTGARRTQDLRGGILATAPFHWDGDMTDMPMLMTTVFVGRMSGRWLSSPEVSAIASWLDAQPALPKSAPSDPEAVARGKELFASAAVGCATCHSGAHFTNNATVAVGTGKAFQVPSLIDVATRAPYLHSGCASTLTARFDPACGGGDSHGKTSQLTTDQIADLVSYLQTL